MVSPKEHKDVALIVGPTASGKSALALELAKKQDSIIINADSAQVYHDLQILSARPDDTEMEGIDHQLYGYIDGSEACSAARWSGDAKAAIAMAHDAGRLPILVGGTGLYVRTLLNGISPIPEIDSGIRDAVRALDTQEAHDALRVEDPASANRLKPRDTSRIMRALEVVRSTGHPLEHWHQHMEGGIGDAVALKPVILLPPRDWLHTRCDTRFEQMMDGGALDEVERLLERKLPPDRPVLRAIGVPEIIAMLAGDLDRKAAIERAQAATRQYAKRQYTWFRNQCPDDWPRIDEIINNVNVNYFVRLLQ